MKDSEIEKKARESLPDVYSSTVSNYFRVAVLTDALKIVEVAFTRRMEKGVLRWVLLRIDKD